jgi:hypothetical protein
LRVLDVFFPRLRMEVIRDQQLAHNIERDFVPGQRNVHSLYASTQKGTPEPPTKVDKRHNPIQSDKWAKKVGLDVALPNNAVLIGEGQALQEEASLLDCLRRNKNVFAWSSSDLVRVNRSVIDHNLHINSSVHPKK